MHKYLQGLLQDRFGNNMMMAFDERNNDKNRGTADNGEPGMPAPAKGSKPSKAKVLNLSNRKGVGSNVENKKANGASTTKGAVASSSSSSTDGSVGGNHLSMENR